MRPLPRSPTESVLGELSTPQAVAKIRHQNGLNKPIYIQYWDYLKTIGSGDLGTSIASTRTITYELGHRFPATVELALAAMMLALALGIPLGFLAAKKYGSWFDPSSLVASLIGISIPIFFLGLILKYAFAVRLHWLPSIAREDLLATRKHPTNFYLLTPIIERHPPPSLASIKHLILPP